jgi:hypothetical protein
MKKIALLIFFASLSASSNCSLPKQFPHEGTWTLSNGVQVAVPTHAQELDSYIVFGSADSRLVSLLLSPYGLKPLEVAGRAIGALSVFNYRKSDIGPFKESYFVLLAYDPKRPLQLGLFHVFAWSDSVTGALMSEEMWNIPSRVAKITLENQRKEAVKLSIFSVFEMTWNKKPIETNPIGHNMKVYATAAAAGELRWSPIQSCGASGLNAFTSNDRLTVHDPELKALFSKINFTPRAKEISINQQAVQFLPVE